MGEPNEARNQFWQKLNYNLLLVTIQDMKGNMILLVEHTRKKWNSQLVSFLFLSLKVGYSVNASTHTTRPHLKISFKKMGKKV